MKATYTITFADGTTEKFERTTRIFPTMENPTDRTSAILTRLACDGVQIDKVEESFSRTEAGRTHTGHTILFKSDAQKEREEAESMRQSIHFNHQYATSRYLDQLKEAAQELRRAADEMERMHLILQTAVILPDSPREPYGDVGLLPSTVSPIRFATQAVELVTRVPNNTRVHYLVQYAAELADSAKADEKYLAC